ncbi:hypothetical protein B6I72_12665 [Klebsiella pneumoniae]|nr:hypothetical protein BVZ24_25830 [Klebsiella pneumoniae]PLD75837.1 hypothetical protein B6I59_26845 [Klebsiella pneumoniae]PLE43374.1 hypothetical protein B6I72_12665 [Klebsiella pneumoniae]PLE51515.1 hypothetical protein B6I73_26410 [Klebsiella pneumoniae]PLF54318.1 hypothetical protein B6I96_26010 [Klebsiella pneumoniae]
MFNPSAALFANTMLMFRLMFFHIKNPAKAGFIMLQYFSQANLRQISPQQKAEEPHCHSGNLLVFSALHTAEIHVNYVPP